MIKSIYISRCHHCQTTMSSNIQDGIIAKPQCTQHPIIDEVTNIQPLVIFILPSSTVPVTQCNLLFNLPSSSVYCKHTRSDIIVNFNNPRTWNTRPHYTGVERGLSGPYQRSVLYINTPPAPPPVPHPPCSPKNSRLSLSPARLWTYIKSKGFRGLLAESRRLILYLYLFLKVCKQLFIIKVSTLIICILLGSFRTCKSPNSLGVQIRKVKIRKFLWLIRKSQIRKFIRRASC